MFPEKQGEINFVRALLKKQADEKKALVCLLFIFVSFSGRAWRLPLSFGYRRCFYHGGFHDLAAAAKVFQLQFRFDRIGDRDGFLSDKIRQASACFAPQKRLLSWLWKCLWHRRRFRQALRKKIPGKACGQKLEHGVFRFPGIGQYALHHILGVHDRAGKNMVPQQLLIDFLQGWEYLQKGAHHIGKGVEIAGIPLFVVLVEKGAVSKPVIKDRFVRVGDPKPKVRLPQAPDRFQRSCEQKAGIEFQLFKNRGSLPVHIGKALPHQLILAAEIAVQGPGRKLRQFTDILDPHPFQTVLPHGPHGGNDNAGSGIFHLKFLPLRKN